MLKTRLDEKLLALSVLLFSLISLLPFIPQFHGGSQDEGLLLYNSQRILSGEVPYRDFFSHYPPLTLWLVAGWFKLWGANIFSARVFMVLTGVLMAWLVYLIGRELLPRRAAWSAALLFICSGVNCWPVVSHHWNGVLFLLLTFWVFLLYQKQKSFYLLYLTGFLTSLTFFLMQTEGFALAIALLIYLTFSDFKNLLKYLHGLLIPALVILGILAVNQALPQYLYQNFLWAREYAIPFNRSPYTLAPLIRDWLTVAGQLLQVKVFNWAVLLWVVNAFTYWLVEAVKYGLFYPVLLLSVFLALKGKELSAAYRPLVLLLAVWCGFSFYRQDLLYLNYHTPVFCLLLVFLLLRLKSPSGRIILGGLALTFLISNSFLLQSCRDFKYPLNYPLARLYTNEKIYAEKITPLLIFLEKNTVKGETIFTFPNASAFYFLTGRRNPTSYNILYPLMSPRAMVLNAKTEIEADKTRYLFKFKITPSALDAYPKVNPQAYFREDEYIRQILTYGYREIKDYDFCQVYQRI